MNSLGEDGCRDDIWMALAAGGAARALGAVRLDFLEGSGTKSVAIGNSPQENASNLFL